MVGRSGTSAPMALQPYSLLFPGDVIETAPQSRLKAMLEEHILVTLSPGSRLELLRPYGPDTEVIGMRLQTGSAQFILDEELAAKGQHVRVQTPTASILTQRGAFLVQVQEPSGIDPEAGNFETTRVTSLGTAGDLQVMARGRTVRIAPGQSTIVKGGEVPSAPILVKVATPSSALARALQDTTLHEERRLETPRAAFLANGGTEPGKLPAPQTSAEARAQHTPPLVPQTPPAVISGAVSGTVGGAVPPGASTVPQIPVPTIPVSPAPAPTPVVTPAPPVAPAPAPALPPPPPPPAPVVVPSLPTLPQPPTITIPRPVIPRIEIDDDDDRSGPNRGRR